MTYGFKMYVDGEYVETVPDKPEFYEKAFRLAEEQCSKVELYDNTGRLVVIIDYTEEDNVSN